MVDPHVKGAAVLTDTDALAELLATTDETLLRRPYLRWKPGTSCVAALELASGPAYAAAFSAAAGGKLAKTVEQAPAGSVLLADHELGVLVARPAADRDLPALQDLNGALARIQAHPRSTIGHSPAEPSDAGPSDAGPSDAVQTLAYKPFRRWVGTFSTGRTADPPGDGRYVARAYRPEDLERARTNLSRARRRLGRLTPEPVGYSRRWGLMVQAWVPGEPLDQVLAAGRTPADTLPTVGRTLADLHQHRSSRSVARVAGASPDAIVELLGALDPDLGDCAAHLAARLESGRPEEGELVFVHGDFSLDQVVLGPDGPVFLDWDRAGTGVAAIDLASMRAAGLDAESWQLVLNGYGEVRPLPRDLDWYVAAAVLERAAEPFRAGHREWLSETDRRLADVQQLLA